MIRNTSCAAWRLLYDTLLAHGITPGTVAFTRTGKPYFEDAPIHFSLSHSRGVCAVSIADVPTGVDVELCRASYPVHLVERSLSDNEKRVFQGDFTGIWCRKEALAKMTGEGITGYPAGLDTETAACVFQEERLTVHNARYVLAAAFESTGIGQQSDGPGASHK